MPSSISNHSQLPAKNYGEDYDPDFSAETDEFGDIPESEVDVYWDEPGTTPGEESAPLSAESLRAQINDLLNQEELSDSQKRALKSLLPQISAAVRNPEKLAALAETLYQIQDEIFGVPDAAPEGEAASDGETLEDGEEPSLLEQMNQLREKIAADPNLGDDADKLLADLDKLIANADLHQDDPTFLDKLSEKFSTLSEDYVTRSLNGGTGKAQDLADQLGIGIEEVVSAAEAAGVDLEKPQVDDKLMKMLESLGVPSSEDLATYGGLRDKRSQAISDLNLQADAATANWKIDSEAIPDVNIWNQLFKYYKGNDDLSSQLKGIEDKMLGQLSGAMGALGLSATAGSEAGRITVNGVEYDFLNEDTGTYKLDTVFNHLTDPTYSPAPRNTEAGDFWSDEAGTFWTSVGHRDSDAGGEGFPVVSFSSG